MTITDIKIRKLFDGSEGTLRAVLSVTFDDQLAVHDMKLIHAKERLFLIMPGKKNPDGTFKDTVHPINSEFRQTLENAALKAYELAIAAAE